MGRRKKVDNNSEPRSQRAKMKKDFSQKFGKVETIRTKYKRESYDVMRNYIIKNYRKALNKLKRAMEKGYYSASDVLQDSNAKLHMMYKKISQDSEVSFSAMYDGSKYNELMRDFKKFGISALDTSTLYHTIDNILSVDARKASREYKMAMERFNKDNMDYLSQFRRLSKLSSDFHELFAFLSYDDVAFYMETGYSDESIIEKYLEMTKSKWLTYDSVTKERKARLDSKIKDKLDGKYLDYLRKKGYDI